MRELIDALFLFMGENRGSIAAVVIASLVVAFIWSIFYGVQQTRLRATEDVFGDPLRTERGWYWAVTGISALLLIWFYFSWGMARAYFPNAGNELCQSGKVDTALQSFNGVLLAEGRYLKGTSLLVRERGNLAELRASLAQIDGAPSSDAVLLARVEGLIDLASDDTGFAQTDAYQALVAIEADLRAANIDGFFFDPAVAEANSQAQTAWSFSNDELPLLPETERGMKLDAYAQVLEPIGESFAKLRHISPAMAVEISAIKAEIKTLRADLKAASAADPGNAFLEQRSAWMKSLDSAFKRLDDGVIFPPNAYDGVSAALEDVRAYQSELRGGLSLVDDLFMPGRVVKAKTRCSEQGSANWLPKPTDVIATVTRLFDPANGFKNIAMITVVWKPVGELVAVVVPDQIADWWPGEYPRHNADGTFDHNMKSRLLDFATGNYQSFAIPVLTGHVWDSMWRVIVALALGVGLGVPLGLAMGVSRFFKNTFDPLIELYRPVPPLAWAPLILTIFGIYDEGKIFLLFMVAFAIMVIAARTGATGTQLSKIRASHSLGAGTGQILRNVIFPNALPEILTGVRISIGVCWGTLVAAEMLAGTTGVGFIENVARKTSDYEVIWVTILIMGVLGLLFDLAMRWVIARTIPWRGKG